MSSCCCWCLLVNVVVWQCVCVASSVVQHIDCSEFFNTCFGAFLVAWLSADILLIFRTFSLVGFCLSRRGRTRQGRTRQDSDKARRRPHAGQEEDRRRRGGEEEVFGQVLGSIWPHERPHPLGAPQRMPQKRTSVRPTELQAPGRGRSKQPKPKSLESLLRTTKYVLPGAY